MNTDTLYQGKGAKNGNASLEDVCPEISGVLFDHFSLVISGILSGYTTAGAMTYTAIDLGILGGSYGMARGINNAGQVVSVLIFGSGLVGLAVAKRRLGRSNREANFR